MSRVYVAIDTPDLAKGLALGEAVKPHVGGLKLGLEFLTANGPEGLRRMAALGLPIFADTKFHDIPNTVAGAARAIAAQGVAMFNVHAAGGEAMMRTAREAARDVDAEVKVIAVTVLTSLGDSDLASVGQIPNAAEQVMRLATLAKACGLDGVVCSAHEAARLRTVLGPDFLLVVPGIRPDGAEMGDQRRVMGPTEAVRAGADILVIGRPITGAPDPAKAARAIALSLSGSTA